MNVSALTISDVLSHLLDIRGITEASLAKALNIPRATINKIRSGKIQSPRSVTLSMIANYFDITVDQLIGASPLFNDTAVKFIQIPIINLENVNDIHQSLSQITFINHDNWMLLECADKYTSPNNLFAIKIASDAMLPYFDSDTTVIIDPDAAVVNRRYVLVRIARTNEILLRQIFVDGQTQILKPINSIFKTIELSPEDEVIGVVVQSKRDF